MRIFLLSLALLIIAGSTHAQTTPLERELSAFEKTLNDSLPPALYLDAVFCSEYHLINNTPRPGRMQIWNGDLGDTTAGIMRIADIRWRFGDKAEALRFHEKFLPVNSEYGERARRPKIRIKGVSELRVFRENERVRYMAASIGQSMNFYYFIFVVDNCVAKVFVNTRPEVTVEEAAVFAREAARRMRESGRKYQTDQ